MVTGLSGAGRSTAAKCLEDLGWFVVDNLPPELIATMVELGAQAQGAVTKVAVVMDVRSRAFTDDLAGGHQGPRRPRVQAAGAVPGGHRRGAGPPVRGRSAAGTRCRATAGWSTASPPSATCSAPLREDADLVLDTSTLSVHQLRAKIEDAFGTDVGHARPG